MRSTSVYFVLGAHYRAHQNFTMRALDAARAARAGLVSRVAALARAAAVDDPANDFRPGLHSPGRPRGA